MNETETIREQAKQIGLTAQAEAEAMRTKANALASNPKLVEYEWVQKWNGVDNRTHVFGNTPTVMLTK